MEAHQGLLDPVSDCLLGAWTVLTIQTEFTPPRVILLGRSLTPPFPNKETSPRFTFEAQVMGLCNQTEIARKGLEPVEKHAVQRGPIAGDDTGNTLTRVVQYTSEVSDPDWGVNIKSVSSLSKKSIRLARCCNASVLERAKLRKAHLREGTIAESHTPTPAKASGPIRYPGSAATLYNKIKLKGAKCGISLNDEEVRSFKAFRSAST